MNQQPSTTCKPPRERLLLALIWLTLLATFPTLYMGSFTTTIGAGMVFPDWPLSHGSLNPDGWLQDMHMFAEHSHRLFAGLTALLSLAVAWAHGKYEPRAWVRRLSYAAVILVFVQALLGGLRVIMDNVDLAIPHAFAGQTFLCLIAALGLSHFKMWHSLKFPKKSTDTLGCIRRSALLLVTLIFVQLVVAAVMRHKGAGLAIPTFPLSTPEGDLLPVYWNFGVTIHFAHRVIAAIITLVFIVLAVRAWRHPQFPIALKSWLSAVAALLIVQIALGASIIWTGRAVAPTTVHVVIGAFLLCSCFIISFSLYKPFIEKTLDESTS